MPIPMPNTAVERIFFLCKQTGRLKKNRSFKIVMLNYACKNFYKLFLKMYWYLAKLLISTI